MNKVKNKKTIRIIVFAVLACVLVSTFLAPVAVYEAIFSVRYEPDAWSSLSAEDFEGLQVIRSDFENTSGMQLAGFQYACANQTAKGVVVLAHGLGGGGHTPYLAMIDALVKNGYFVFAYDATGNGESDGRNVRGFPQGIADLDSAISHVASLEAYASLPVFLFGHSWGAYAAGSVLEQHPEIKAAVLMAGFNESEDMLSYYSVQRVGVAANAVVPYLSVYEIIKFGKTYSDASVINGIKNTTAGILFVQSKDDATVPAECGYVQFFKTFEKEERISFIEYENKGHGAVYCSDAAIAYRAQLAEELPQGNLDKKKYYEPDAELLEKILALYEAYGVC